MKTTKEIKTTYRITVDKRYNEVIVLDEDLDETKDIGWDWDEAGYSWEKDIAPIIALVLADGETRFVTMVRDEVVETFGSIAESEAFEESLNADELWIDNQHK